MRLLFLLWFFLMFLAIGQSQDASSTEQHRNRLISDLIITYVDRPDLPSNDTRSSILLNNSDIATNQNLTGFFWSNANNEAAHTFVQDLLQPPTTDEQRKLQYLFASILKIQDRRVIIYIFNDKSNSSLQNHASYHSSWGLEERYIKAVGTASPNAWVWPNAKHQIIESRDLAGYLNLGSAFLSSHSGGQDGAYGLLIAKLIKTQDNSGHGTIFENFSLGMDNTYSLGELLSNYFITYNEALGFAFELLYTRTANIYDLLNDNYVLKYEVIPQENCADLPPNSCLDQYLLNTYSLNPTVLETVNRKGRTFTENQYHIRDLPADVLIRNVIVQGYIYYAFMEYLSVEAMIYILRNTREQTNGRHAFPYILEQMVITANNYRSTPGNEKSKYFPLALLDFYTGFKLDSEASLNECLRTRNTDTWSVDISNYWSQEINNPIQNKWIQNNYRFTIPLLYNIAVYCGVRSR